MGPAEYVAYLESELKLARAERDWYQNKVHELEQRVRSMTSAATSAAASTVTALDRVALMDPIVKALQASYTRRFLEAHECNEVLRTLEAYEKVVALRD